MTTIPPEAIEAAARAMAILGDYDGCFERLDGADPDGEEPMSSDEEDAEWWRARARAAITAALPHIEAAIRERIAGEIATSVPYNFELRPDGTEDHDSSIYAGALHDAARIARGDSHG